MNTETQRTQRGQEGKPGKLYGLFSVFPPSVSSVSLCSILILILAVGFAVRMYRLGAPSTWFDERASIMSSAGHMGDWLHLPLNQVIDPPDLTSPAHAGSWLSTWKSPDFHPPLYAVVLRLWRDVVGEGDAKARGLSVVASLAGILCLFDLVRTFSGARAALWAAALMAVAQPEIEFAQEARGYALWGALGLGACAAAARLLKHGPGWRRAIALAGCLLGMLLTHFLAVACAAAVAIWCAIYLRGRALRQALIAGGVALVALIIVGSGLPLQAYQTHQDASWLRESPANHIQNTLWRLAITPACFLAAPRAGTESAAAGAAVVYVLPLLLCRGNPGMLLCALWLYAGVGAIFLVDLLMDTQALLYIRFTLVAAPAVYWIIATLPLRRGLRDVVPLLAVIGCLFALPWDYVTDWKGDWRELGSDVRQAARAGDLIVFAAPVHAFLGDPFKLYEGVDYYAEPIPCPVLLLDHAPDVALLAKMRQAERVWVVTGESAPEMAALLPGWSFTIAGGNRIFASQLYRAGPYRPGASGATRPGSVLPVGGS
jgi:Dolichyl-phosphate-mannose-protein mannosyltransferase